MKNKNFSKSFAQSGYSSVGPTNQIEQFGRTRGIVRPSNSNYYAWLMFETKTVSGTISIWYESAKILKLTTYSITGKNFVRPNLSGPALHFPTGYPVRTIWYLSQLVNTIIIRFGMIL